MTNINQIRRFFGRFCPVLAVALLTFGIGAACLDAQTPAGTAVRVEEDWQLVVAQPDIINNGPQVTCTMAPAGMASGYAAFDFDYQTQPGYSPGGARESTSGAPTSPW